MSNHLEPWLHSPETYDDEDAAVRQRAALCDEVERRLRFAERITDLAADRGRAGQARVGEPLR